ncbi:hypothetical protein CB1_002337001 [Camelus ferus]|nr:hypothetical protein CB1_002337001 [Camelus ferus]
MTNSVLGTPQLIGDRPGSEGGALGPKMVCEALVRGALPAAPDSWELAFLQSPPSPVELLLCPWAVVSANNHRKRTLSFSFISISDGENLVAGLWSLRPPFHRAQGSLSRRHLTVMGRTVWLGCGAWGHPFTERKAAVSPEGTAGPLRGCGPTRIRTQA